MNIVIDQPLWLGAILIGLASAAAGWVILRAIPAGRRSVAVGARLVLFALLALALAGTQIVRTTDRLTVIGVVDMSESVRAYADLGTDDAGIAITPIDAAEAMLTGEDPERQGEDRVGMIAFDRAARVVSAPSAGPLIEPDTTPPGAEGTDIAGALRRAQALVPEDSRGRLVLLSDGVSTTGDLGSFTPTHPIDVVPIEYRVEREVVVESVRAPSTAAPGAEIPIEVALRATAPAEGTLSVLVDGRVIDLDPGSPDSSLALALGEGVETIALRVPIDEGRVHRIRARWDAVRGDTSAANNESSAITLARDRGRVLVVAPGSDRLDRAAALTRVLEDQEWGVDARLAREMPQSMLGLERYDLVVLIDTPRDAVPRDAESAIDQYVRTLGGGVLFIGGERALGAGGWQSAPIADLFPVDLEVPDDVVRAHAAVMLVLDSSGSMRRTVLGSSRSQQQVANESAAEAIGVLDPTDLVGVVEFSDSARVVVELRRNNDPGTTRERIRSIRPGGGTNLGPALEEARDQLTRADAQNKHIVVLSDGKSRDAGALPALAEGLEDDGIKVSTITIGDEADSATMRAIAENSGGVFYRVVNPNVLPRVFLKAVRVIRKPMVREGAITPVIASASSPMIPELGELPILRGIVLTEFKSDDPRVMVPIVSAQGEPILAGHQVELGRVGVFTSDASDWAREWIDSDAFGTVARRVIDWAARSGERGPGEVRTTIEGSDLTIRYDAIDDDDAPIDGAEVAARVIGSDGATREISLVQSGPGVYEASARDLASGDHIVVVRPEIGGEPARPSIAGVHINPRAELATLASDRGALERLAQRSGGRVLNTDTAGVSLFDRSGLEPVRSYEPIWRALLIAALVVFLIDLAARRVAWDRWLAQARAETIAVTRAVRAERVGAVRERVKRAETEPQEPQTRPPEPRAPQRAEPQPARTDHDEEGDEDEPGSLLAAKRRARQQYEDRAGD